MPQFGSMDEEKVKKQALLLSAMNKKPPPPSSFLSDAQVFSLLAALIFAFLYAVLASYNLRDPHHKPSCQEAGPAWLVGCYELRGADAVDAARALWRGLRWCGEHQALASPVALKLLADGHSRRGLRVRFAAFIALAATAASHWMYMYFRILGLARIGRPWDLFFAIETAGIVAAAALDLVGFMAFVLGGDD